MQPSSASDDRPAGCLLGPGDPDPVGILNAKSRAPVLIVCEHGGQAVPAALDGLGVTQAELDSHIGWDIGALPVARRIAEGLDAPMVHQRYSRLVYDCNRPPESPEAMPAISHGTAIPGNRDLTATARAARHAEIFEPYDAAVRALLDVPRRAAFSIHSFTPELGGATRPWSVGLLSRADDRTAETLLQHLGAAVRDGLIARNQPYRIEDGSDWFIPRHAERLGLAHCLIEIRNDLLGTEADQTLWADRLTRAFQTVIEELA